MHFPGSLKFQHIIPSEPSIPTHASRHNTRTRTSNPMHRIPTAISDSHKLNFLPQIMSDRGADHIAHIVKEWIGCCKEATRDVDTYNVNCKCCVTPVAVKMTAKVKAYTPKQHIYSVSVPMDMDAKVKAIVFASTLLLVSVRTYRASGISCRGRRHHDFQTHCHVYDASLSSYTAKSVVCCFRILRFMQNEVGKLKRKRSSKSWRSTMMTRKRTC